ncbi:hypothetical protein T09_15469 [Trichinella sp. T9]|nr:hypothetical protein T09_15469 [Trichinella sp. T9]KRX58430.1 hypothetical protein T09_15469 [Trichinella sp. T9]
MSGKPYNDPVRCELYLVGQARENSFEELKRELLNTYGPEKSFVELIKRIHALCQRESQFIKQCAEEVAKLGRRACVSERDLVALLAGGLASKEVHRAIWLQDPPTLAEAHKVAKKTITDVTPSSYASENERRREERWRPSTLRPVAWSPSQVPLSLTMIYDKYHQRAPALLHNKKKAQMTVRVRRPIAIAHRLVSGC